MPDKSDYNLGLAEKINDTTWRLTISCKEWNTSYRVEVMETGMAISHYFFSWEEIEEAKNSLLLL